MFKGKRWGICDKVSELQTDVARLRRQYDKLSNDYEFLKDKVDYIIVKAHCPVCGSEMRLQKDKTIDHWGFLRNCKYYLTCPKDNYTVEASTLKGVFNKIPKKD